MNCCKKVVGKYYECTGKITGMFWDSTEKVIGMFEITEKLPVLEIIRKVSKMYLEITGEPLGRYRACGLVV